VRLRRGETQEYLANHRATAALVIDHFLIHCDEGLDDSLVLSDKPLDADSDWEAIRRSAVGFAVEFADAGDYPDFAAFLAHLRDARVEGSVDAETHFHNIRYASGGDLLEMGVATARSNASLPLDQVFSHRRVNGENPDLPPGVERVSPFSVQASTGAIELGGAVLRTTPGRMAVLQREPGTGVILAANALTELNDFALTAPDGFGMSADGKIGIAIVTYDGANRRLSIEHAFLPGQEAEEGAATGFTVVGGDPGLTVELNGEPVQAAVVEQDGRRTLRIDL
jgi:hypothetical protein